MMKLMNWYHALGLAAALGAAFVGCAHREKPIDTATYLRNMRLDAIHSVAPYITKKGYISPAQKDSLTSNDPQKTVGAARTILTKKQEEMFKKAGWDYNGGLHKARGVRNSPMYLEELKPVNCDLLRMNGYYEQMSHNELNDN